MNMSVDCTENNCTTTQQPTGGPSGDQHSFYQWSSFACGVILIPVAIFGIIGNTITVCIFCRQNMASSINTLLVGLAIFDLWLLLTATPMFSTLAISALLNSEESLRVVAFLTLYIYPLSTMAQSASAWTMIVISVERYLAVCRPFVALVVCTVKRAVVALGIVLFVAILYNVCRFFEYRPDGNSRPYFAPLLRHNEWYMKIYINCLYLVCMFILPFGVLVVLNSMVIVGLRKARADRRQLSCQQNNEHKTALMMIVVMLIFLLCNSLALALNAIETLNELSTNKKYAAIFFLLSDVNNVLVEVNSSINCVVYYYFSQKFRLAFGQLFCSSNMSKPTIKSSVTFELPLSNYCNHDSLTEHSLLLVSSVPSRKNTLITTKLDH